MIYNILILILISFLPIFELRLAIPVGILFMGMDAGLVFGIVVLSNFVIGIIIYFLVEFLIRFFCKIKFIDKIYRGRVLKIQKKIHPHVQKYGWIALALFIGIPMPGSGVYTGALAGKVLGMDVKEFILSCLLGVVIAGIIMSLLSLSFGGVLSMVGEHNVELIRKVFGL